MKPEKQLYQWDVNQYLTGINPAAQYVDYAIGKGVIRMGTDGTRCRIPDELLQTDDEKTCYERYPDGTFRAYSFTVLYAPKPPDYTFTPEEHTTFESLTARVDAAIDEINRRADSGEFTPKKGVDYFTNAEKAEMMESVSSGAVGEFREVVNSATADFNENSSAKTNDYNRNAAEKLEAYNSNHTAKVAEYNQNAETKTAEFDSNAAAIRNQVTDLKSDLGDLINTTTTVEQIDETVSISPNLESGYVTPTGVLVSSSDYTHSEISVNSGDVIRFYRADGGAINSARFICVYVGDNVDERLGGANVPIPYTVPNGVSKIVFTLLSDYVGAVCKIDTTIKTLIPVFKKDVESLKAYNKADNYIYKTIETMSANDNFTLVDNLDAKKNTVLEFYGEFQDFIKLDLCHGGAINYGSRVEITSDKVSVYYDNATTPFISEYHNLNISDFVSVRIEQGNTADCYVYVMTKDGLFKSSKSLAYHSCRGAVYATSETDMSNVKLQYILKDMLTDVFIFGDSYITLADPSRYPKHLISYGYDKYLLCGFGGANSSDEILTFREVMAIRKPLYCVWALGMNDGDSETEINANWKTCVEEISEYCDGNGIELILATIPNTPVINNSYKNAYVKASGNRYVDYAKAVGAESSGSSWYSGMLHADNVHPTELGAKALCERLMLDVPEILN